MTVFGVDKALEVELVHARRRDRGNGLLHQARFPRMFWTARQRRLVRRGKGRAS